MTVQLRSAQQPSRRLPGDTPHPARSYPTYLGPRRHCQRSTSPTSSHTIHPAARKARLGFGCELVVGDGTGAAAWPAVPMRADLLCGTSWCDQGDATGRKLHGHTDESTGLTQPECAFWKARWASMMIPSEGKQQRGQTERHHSQPRRLQVGRHSDHHGRAAGPGHQA